VKVKLRNEANAACAATPRTPAEPRVEEVMEPDRKTTVLFADVTGSTRLYEAAGDNKALEVIGNCIETLRRAVDAAGGRVVKTMGDEMMALFSTPDQAADAATRMHVAIDALPVVDGHKLAVRIGFHAGPVIQRDNDVFGDTVNIASRLAEQATQGQALTSAETVSLLGPVVRNVTRRLYDVTVKGKVNDIGLCELLWRKSPDITQLPVGNSAVKAARVTLRLRYRGEELVRRRLVESITFGRDPHSEVVVSDPTASRHHCVIERHQDKFVVRDHSSNGTYVTVEGEGRETVLRREELALRGHGWLAFGQPRAATEEPVEYWCE
jgi:class 3 adenylate cyclase